MRFGNFILNFYERSIAWKILASAVYLGSAFCKISVIGKAETALVFALIFFGRISFF
jgi:hypothetical protein